MTIKIFYSILFYSIDTDSNDEMLHKQTNNGREAFHAEVGGGTLMGGPFSLLQAVLHK